MNSQQVIQRAMRFHQAGKLDEAKHLYKDVIRAEPRHFDAMHLLGVLHIDQKDYLSGAQLIQNALSIRPGFAKAHFNLGLAFLQLGQHENAVRSFKQATQLQPNYAEAFNSQGNAFAGLNQHGQAVASYDRALALKPQYPEAFCNRAVVLHRLGRYDDALLSFDRALALRPENGLALRQRGDVLMALQRYTEALGDYERAVVLTPESPEMKCGRANALAALSRHEESLAQYDQVIATSPNSADAFAGRGGVLAQLGKFDAAMLDYAHALAIDPKHLDALHKRGLSLLDLRRHEEAIADFDAVLRLRPDHLQALIHLGRAYLRQRMLEAALECFNAALALREVPTTLFDKAEALLKLRRLDECIAVFERAFAVDPEATRWYYSSMAVAKLLACDWTDREQLIATLHRLRVEQDVVVPPFVLMCIETDAAVQLECANRLVGATGLQELPAIASHLPAIPGPIRIAYLSANFNAHPVAYSIVELLEKHDRTRFEVIALSFGVDDGSEIRSRVMNACDRFIDVRGRTDYEVASLMLELGVSIAIDLMGHTDDSRPAILAHRPAPVQVNYLGYPGTLGAAYIDYIVVDRFVVPEAQRRSYREQIAWLPDCYLPGDSQRRPAERIPTREEQGLPVQGFVFCSFNAHYKITPAMFDIWMNLLRGLPESVLWLQGSNELAERNLRREALLRGIDADRVIFARRVDRLEDHLARHACADLFLDAFPYNAHTTARDSLRAGLPVLTCAGATFASRVAGSILHTAGLPDLVASSLEEYEGIALKFARDAQWRAQVRERVAACRDNEVLFNGDRSRRNLENAYMKMMEIWQQGEPPQSFGV